ncbi:MAG: glycosyl hydrolase [Cellulomonas sp.]
MRTRTLAALTAAALITTLAATPSAATTERSVAGVAEPTISIVDPDADAPTRSLFSYLRDVRGLGQLFGHQHATSDGVSIGVADGTTSDVKNGVGDHPGMFGWDTLVLQGSENPGRPANTTSQNVAALADYMEKADAVGGINTLSGHVPNFVTGNDFYDTSGDVVAAILPGGAKNAELNAYLDTIAELAHSLKDADGNPIPVIYRPWHENNGSWFWWGAGSTTAGQYRELFRYTVEYLRDTKDVHNFLYATSPSGPFGGDSASYLSTYPGDDYVDILGYDRYDETSDASAQWLAGTVQDLAMIANLADARGKVSALTEYGVKGGTFGANGTNPNLHWFTDVLNAITADPAASRSAYALTWSNWSASSFMVPYPATATEPEHELLPDFRTYYADPFTIFASEVVGAVDRTGIATTPHAASVHLVSPAGGQRIVTPTTTVRARVLDTSPSSVSFTVGDNPAPQTLTLDNDGYFSATWVISPDSMTNRTEMLTVTAVTSTGTVITDTQNVILGAKPEPAPGVVDDFEGYGDNVALRSEYATYGVNSIALSTDHVGEGSQALQFNYDFSGQNYTGVGTKYSGDWSGFDRLRFWVQPDGSGHKLVLQVVAGGVSFEAYPSLAGTTAGWVEIPFAEWRPAPWDSANADKRLDGVALTQLTQFNIYINQNEVPTTAGTFYLDGIRATDTALPTRAPGRPTLTDDSTRKHESSLHESQTHDGDFTLTATLKRGQNATVARFYEDGVLIATHTLTDKTPAKQQTTLAIVGKKPGRYVYTVAFVNEFGETTSRPDTVVVTDGHHTHPSHGH